MNNSVSTLWKRFDNVVLFLSTCRFVLAVGDQ
jgi:hypothetical protein